MKEPSASRAVHSEPEIYEIRVDGHLHDRWKESFEDMALCRERDGTTTLCGRLVDQTALHSVLLKIRNMNLKLLSVRTMANSPKCQANCQER